MRALKLIPMLFLFATAAAADPPVVNERGRALFKQYCASCHGPSAKGDGTLANALKTPPADLTKIAARRQGQFPTAEIAKFIDGREAVMSHGDREMPVWGERFAAASPAQTEKDKEASVSSKLRSLIEYLKSVQEP